MVDGGGKVAFPGVVDAHQHWGIYNPLAEDAVSESRASAQGGVTTALTYMRTGQYYLNKGGDYGDFFPEVLSLTEGRAYVDYAYHLAPMSKRHIEEIPALVGEHGVTSFKIFMFYGGHGLHGRSADQSSFLMTPEGERYDYAHFEFVMRGIQAAREKFPEIADQISLSLHCETAEIMTAYTKLVEEDGTLTGLPAYSASRPPHSEGLAVTIASYLAHETELPTINLLHLTSRKAVEAALRMADAFPHIDFRREVTVGHLLADFDTAHGVGGKVNPPLRPREDVEALWAYLIDGKIDWVVSDHACCKEELKFGEPTRRRLPGQVRLRRRRVPAGRHGLRGLAGAACRFGRIAALTADQPGRALRPRRHQGRDRGRQGRRHRARRHRRSPGPCAPRTRSRRRSTRRSRASSCTAKVTDTFVRGHR